MKTTTKIAVAVAALAGLTGAGLAGAGVAAQAESYRGGREGGPAAYMQEAHGGWNRDMHRGHRAEGGFGHGRFLYRMLDTFDTNGDGKLSQAEIDQVRSDRLTKFDANGDKSLNLEEYQALWLDAMRNRMVDRFQALDENGDGVVTAEEFDQPFSKMVRRMDRNGDGVIDRNDFQRRHHDNSGSDDKG